MVTHGAQGPRSIVVVLEGEGSLGLRRVRWWDRLLVRLRAATLDHELAAGACPEQSVHLALHAGRLCTPRQRHLLAHSLARVAAASDAPRERSLRMPVCRLAVQGARAELAAVAGRLSASGPVDVQGVARVRTLLADGAGLLYRPAAPERLRRELADVLAALDSFD